MISENLKIAIFSNVKIFSDGETFSTHETLPIMINNFSEHFKKVCIIGYVLYSNKEKGRYPIDKERIEIYPLAYFSGGPKQYFTKLPILVFEIMRWFTKYSNKWNAAWIIDPILPSQVFYMFCRLFGMPAVLYLRSNDEYEIMERNKRGLKRLLAILYARYLEFTIPLMVHNIPTLVTGEELYKKYQNSRNNIYKVVATTIQEKAIEHFSTKNKQEPSKEIKLLSVGNLAEIKGHVYLIEALKLLNQRSEYSFTLDLVGTGNYENSIKKKIEVLGLTNKVRLPGYVLHGTKLDSFYQNADIFVLPSLSEGTPKVIPEAMAHGLPVVASNVGGIPSLIRDKVNGILVPPGKPESICDAVLSILGDRRLKEKIIQNSLGGIGNFTIKNMVEGFVKALKSKYPKLMT